MKGDRTTRIETVRLSDGVWLPCSAWTDTQSTAPGTRTKRIQVRVTTSQSFRHRSTGEPRKEDGIREVIGQAVRHSLGEKSKVHRICCLKVSRAEIGEHRGAPGWDFVLRKGVVQPFDELVAQCFRVGDARNMEQV